jgi:hypothetical protein
MANGEPCTPPQNPCDGNPGGTMANGEPCTPPQDPCVGNPGGTMANGEPCTPPQNPCDGNPGGTMANGEPCTPPAFTPPPVTPASFVAVNAEVASRTAVVASARLHGPRRCVTRRFNAVVDGRGIRRITVYVNGRRVRTLAGGRRRYVIGVRVGGAVTRVRARVEFVAASGRRPQTLQMTALRCQRAAVAPQFTG